MQANIDTLVKLVGALDIDLIAKHLDDGSELEYMVAALKFTMTGEGQGLKKRPLPARAS